MGFADDALLTSQSSEWLSVIFALSLKSTVILATTALLKLLLRPASARLRHKLWCAALFSLLVLPLFSGWLQPVKVPILSAELFSAKVAIKQGPQNAAEKLPGQDSATLASDLDRHSGQRADWSLPIADDQPLASDFSWISAVLLVWLIGVLFVVSRFLVGVITVRRLVARATQLTDTSWLDLTAELSEELGLSRPVRLLRSHKSIMPMTCMGITAIVLLPNDADCWSADRRRVVVLHELTHIKRRDLLTLTLSQVVCALYWFNPLVWWAVKRLRTEQEWACDESVVASGIAATDYAAHLLDIARNFHADSLSAVTTTAMAHRSQLQARLCAVLKPVRERYRSGRMIAISVVLSLVFISTAVTRLVTAERTEEADVAKVTNDAMRVEQKDNETFPTSQKTSVAGGTSDMTAKEDGKLDRAPSPTPVNQTDDQPAVPPTDSVVENQTGDQVFDRFSVEECNRLLSNGIGPAYIKEMEDVGYSELSVAQLIALYSNSVRADYVIGLRSVGYSRLSTSDLLSLKTNAVTTDVIRSFQALPHANFKATNYASLLSNGVTPSYARSLSDAGYDSLTANELVAMHLAGITSEFIRDLRDHGNTNLSPNELIELKRHKTP